MYNYNVINYNVIRSSSNIQLKSTYKAIEAYHHNVSGAHWDDTNGANIQGAAAGAVFDAYVSQKVRSLFIYIV